MTGDGDWTSEKEEHRLFLLGLSLVFLASILQSLSTSMFKSELPQTFLFFDADDQTFNQVFQIKLQAY